MFLHWEDGPYNFSGLFERYDFSLGLELGLQ